MQGKARQVAHHSGDREMKFLTRPHIIDGHTVGVLVEARVSRNYKLTPMQRSVHCQLMTASELAQTVEAINHAPDYNPDQLEIEA
jgi:hypothetical protein